jgi:hypothetical protein
VSVDLDHTNTNGLVNGDIPANQPCPFHTTCPMIFERCPTPENLNPHPFSCACARMQSIILNGQKRDAARAMNQQNPTIKPNPFTS